MAQIIINTKLDAFFDDINAQVQADLMHTSEIDTIDSVPCAIEKCVFNRLIRRHSFYVSDLRIFVADCFEKFIESLEDITSLNIAELTDIAVNYFVNVS